VKNPAVVSGLVTGRTSFLLENKDLGTWIAADDLTCCGEANDSSADDCDFHLALGG
jgi:hypothetical protein